MWGSIAYYVVLRRATEEEDGGGVREEDVDCVWVRLKELNSAYWEHVSSFLLGGCMGVRHRKGFFDE